MNRVILLLLGTALGTLSATAQEAPEGEDKLIFGTTSSFGNASERSSVFGKGTSSFGTGSAIFGDSAERQAFFEEEAARANPQSGYQGIGNSLEERKIRLQEIEALRRANRADPENHPVDEMAEIAGFYDPRCFEGNTQQTYVPPNSPRRTKVACPRGSVGEVGGTAYVVRAQNGRDYPISNRTRDESIVLDP